MTEIDICIHQPEPGEVRRWERNGTRGITVKFANLKLVFYGNAIGMAEDVAELIVKACKSAGPVVFTVGDENPKGEPDAEG